MATSYLNMMLHYIFCLYFVHVRLTFSMSSLDLLLVDSFSDDSNTQYCFKYNTVAIFIHRCRTIFWLGLQKLNDFLVGEKQSRQSNSKYNFMQYVFSKKVYAVYNGVWGKAPEAGEFSRIFVLKVTLQSIRLLLAVSYRKNWGSRMY